MTRRPPKNPLYSPLLVGAVTVLVLLVAVFLAFGANNGLPFVPRYNLHVQIRDAEEVTRNGEVYMGGALIGAVSSVTASRSANGTPVAVLNLELDHSVEPLAVNSRFTVRLQGAIGTKIVDITPGSARRGWANGATVPMSDSDATTDLDQVLDMFTPDTRAGVQATTLGFGAGLAGRGGDLNGAIGAFVPLIQALGPVMSTLAAPHTDLSGFISGLGAFAHALAPVADQQAQLFTGLDTTFTALAGVATPYLQDAIADSTPAEQSVTDDGPALRSFVTDATGLLHELRPGFATLPVSAPIVADTFAAGARNLPGTAALDRRVVSLAKSLTSYSDNATVQAGLARLTLTASSLRPPLAFLTPVQSTCNDVTLLLRNFSSTASDVVGSGSVLRFVLIAIDDVAGGEAVPSSTPYLTTGTAGGDNHGPLHVDPYPNTDSPGQTAECSAGNEPYSAAHAVIGNPATDVGLKTESTK